MIERLYSGIPFEPVLEELAQSEWWGKEPFRTNFSPDSPHREVEDIVLRFTDLETEGDAFDTFMCLPMEAWYHHPMCRKVAFDTMRVTEGVMLGRVIVTKLKPGHVIHPHVDEGLSSEIYDRYQLNMAGRCEFRVGEETVVMNPGEMWTFDNLIEHEVKTIGAHDRITMIIDILS